MNIAIIYFSKHHGNTKKLLDGIARENQVTLIDVSTAENVDLNKYDIIGIASGVYYGSLAKQILSFVQNNLPNEKKIFYIYTHGAKGGGNPLKSIRAVADNKKCKELGIYKCQGFNTFGPFKLIGGTSKGHPTDYEISGAVSFFKSLLE